MSIEQRIEKLEERTEGKEQFEICICYIGDKTEPTEAQHETAIADFKAKNPDWQELDYILLSWFDGQYKEAVKVLGKRR